MKTASAAGLFALAAIMGAGLGAAAAWVFTGDPPGRDGVGPGVWRTNTRGVGEASAGLLQRAVIARVGLWALPPSEVIYFRAETDDGGRPLTRNCVYALEGKGELPARWWSIALYRDYFWVDNPDDRYSYSKTTVARAADGSWRILVSSAPQAGNWLPMGARDGRFTLPLRLYQPDPSVAQDPRSVPLPTVRRLSCV